MSDLRMQAAEIGARVREARERRGLSQEALGGLVGVRGMTVYRYEHGAFQPRPGVLAALAEALGVSMEWLATGADAPPEPATGTEG